LWEGWDVARPTGCATGRDVRFGEAKLPERKAAHPNSRFTTADAQQSVQVVAFVLSEGSAGFGDHFGGVEASTVPLVLDSTDLDAGLFRGATMESDTTAAAS